MTEPRTSSRPILHNDVFTEIQSALNRIEDKQDRRLSALETKVDAVASRQDRLEGKLDGVVGVVKWLGPSSVIALIAGLLATSGILEKF